MHEGPAPLTITLRREPAGVVLHLGGEVDLATAPAFRAALSAARPASRQLVVDVERLDFMDSSGLHLLLAEQRAATANGHGFAVAAARGEVRFALRAAGLDTLIPCAPDWRTALATA